MLCNLIKLIAIQTQKFHSKEILSAGNGNFQKLALKNKDIEFATFNYEHVFEFRFGLSNIELRHLVYDCEAWTI